MAEHHDPLEYIEGKLKLVLFLLQNTWGGLLTGIIAVLFAYAGAGVWGSGVALVCAVICMNGGGKFDFVFWGKSLSWWRTHRYLRPFHHATGEGEIAGIGLALILAAVWPSGMEEFHIPWAAFFTVLAVMSASNLAADYFAGILSLIEKYLGKVMMLIIGSLLASLMGEPAAAVLKTEYLKGRYDDRHKGAVATLLSVTIGFGGGLLYHAAPPILIIWGTLHKTFGWSILDLIYYVGTPVVFSVVVGSVLLSRFITSTTEFRVARREEWIAALGLVVLVVLHITAPESKLLWLLDGFIAAMNVMVMNVKYDDARRQREREAHIGRRSDRAEADQQLGKLREEQFGMIWGPILLACLLVALELIGHVGEPFVHMLSELIPVVWPTLWVAIAAFILAAVTSHFADNALASRVYIVIPLALLAAKGPHEANIVAAGVVLGALFGGFLTIPANLPNFTIARRLGVLPGEWFASSWKLYPIGVIPVLWLVFLAR